MVMVLVEQQGQRGHPGEGADGRAMDWVRIWGGRKIPRIKFRFWSKRLEE